MTTCERTVVVLKALEAPPLSVEVDEIDELLAMGLAVEADPEDLTALHWLEQAAASVARRGLTDPQLVPTLQAIQQSIEKDLRNDWYQMTTSRVDRARRDEDRVTIRRALAYLRDPVLMPSLRKILTESAQVPRHVRYVCCPELGIEHYAITHKGARLRRALEVRLGRFKDVPLKTFIAAFDKTEGKMKAFGQEVSTIARNIGPVKKNREQVVIGLAKAGGSASNALGAYHAAKSIVHMPDVAVTCARNAAQFGGPTYAAGRLRQAEAALKQAGFPLSPEVKGAAKCLVGFEPPEAGIARFSELVRLLGQHFGRDATIFKSTSRLMPAHGTPAQVVERVIATGHLVARSPSRVHFGGRDARPTVVALASMARSTGDLPALVDRFRMIEEELVRAGLSDPQVADGHALECVAAPGTPAEVVDTVTCLLEQLTEGRPREKADVTIAVSFAKRFAY